jgi:hypothetical protein
MNRKVILRAVLLVAASLLGFVCCANPPAWSQTRQFQFEQYPVKVYQGPIKIPKWLHKEKDGEWVYETWKPASRPKVTYAGEYDLDGLSCGTDCRFYELSNLRTGVEIPAISMFDAPEPWPKTKDGHPYLTVLFYRPDSRLLIAEYHLDFDDPDKKETCRQRYFVLEDGKIRPISKTFPFCTEDQEQ